MAMTGVLAGVGEGVGGGDASAQKDSAWVVAIDCVAAFESPGSQPTGAEAKYQTLTSAKSQRTLRRETRRAFTGEAPFCQ